MVEDRHCGPTRAAHSLRVACCALLVSLAVTGAAVGQDPSAPEGRPPRPPLYRGEPRVYDVQFSITLLFTSGSKVQPDMLDMAQHAFELPLITQDSLSQVDVTSPRAQMTLLGDSGGGTIKVAVKPEVQADGTLLLLADAGAFKGQHTRLDFSWRTQVWESKLDERAAATVAWPREWPEHAARALRAEPFIECEADGFKQFVSRVTNGQSPRTVPVQTAAKEVIRAAIALMRHVDSEGAVGERGQFRGFALQGALAAANAGTGSCHDLVCVCVAALRAAGIPARPVVGILEESGKNGKTRLASWAEYYLPDAGWVPFDPLALRGAGVQHFTNDRDWSHHGELDDDVGVRIPIAHTFLPPGQSQPPLYAPALWGWRAAGRIQPQGQSFDAVKVQVISRGKGTPDP